MNLTDTFIEHSLWPVVVSLFSQKVFTLIGMRMINDKDVILSNRRYLQFFGSFEEMVDFIRLAKPCNLLKTKQYNDFRAVIHENNTCWKFKYVFYDYQKIGELIRKKDYINWNVNKVDMIVDGLNFLQDAVCTIDDKKGISYFFRSANKGKPTNLSNLLDMLTFYNPVTKKSQLPLGKRFDWDDAYSQFTEVLGRVSLRSKIYDGGCHHSKEIFGSRFCRVGTTSC